MKFQYTSIYKRLYSYEDRRKLIEVGHLVNEFPFKVPADTLRLDLSPFILSMKIT